jgi:hypothetical protein
MKAAMGTSFFIIFKEYGFLIAHSATAKIIIEPKYALNRRKNSRKSFQQNVDRGGSGLFEGNGECLALVCDVAGGKGEASFGFEYREVFVARREMSHDEGADAGFRGDSGCLGYRGVSGLAGETPLGVGESRLVI